MGSKGIVASSAAMGILLQQGIGDTIRVSLTPEPRGDRTREVQVAQELLQTMGFRQFVPVVAACPGCGRTTSTVFQELAQTIQDDIRRNMPAWREQISGRRGAEGRGDGLHRQRARRIQACRYRHLACPAPAKCRPRRFSSTAARRPPCAAPTSPTSSRRWSRTISNSASAAARRRPNRRCAGCAKRRALLAGLLAAAPALADPPGKGRGPSPSGASATSRGACRHARPAA